LIGFDSVKETDSHGAVGLSRIADFFGTLARVGHSSFPGFENSLRFNVTVAFFEEFGMFTIAKHRNIPQTRSTLCVFVAGFVRRRLICFPFLEWTTPTPSTLLILQANNVVSSPLLSTQLSSPRRHINKLQ